ncbi:DNA cytosine methyltransferase [Paenibacillus lautus]|uniref:DNA cytosine methyltransferase n=1 Tax=Paenibacillus lautus TaxID=1401 RepID=UPI003D2E44AD
MKSDLNYIDLFSGCGGLSLGLYKAGWKGLFAIEKSNDAFDTLKHNLILKCNHFQWPEWLSLENHDIKDILSGFKNELMSLKGEVELVVGGPPCQGFSMAGKRNEDDIRNQLVHSYLEFIDLVRPNYIFFENVKGFTVSFDNKKKSKPFSQYIGEQLEEMGYNVSGRILDFSEYGVPQRRKRFILIGALNSQAESFFDKIDLNKDNFLKRNKLKRRNTISDAISDLLRENGVVNSPDKNKFDAGIYGISTSSYQKFLRKGFRYTGKVADSHRFPNHKGETVKIFRNVIENAPRNRRLDGDYKELYGLNRRGAFLLDINSICPTITSNPDDYIHYTEPRILTVREYARIQSFPDWYEFKGKYTTGGERRVVEVPRYTQIGNAIPPLFGEQAGIVLKEMVLNERKAQIQD